MPIFKSRTRPWLVVAIVFIGLLAATRSVQAQGIVGGSRIPTGVIFDNDAFLIGDNIVLDGTVTGDVLALGRTVIINGNVDGSLVALAETVTVNGEVDGSLYSGAVTLETGETASIGRSAYFAGARLVTQPDSEIGRDLVAGTLGAQLGGSVGRDVKAVVGLVAIVERLLEATDIRLFSSQELTPMVEGIIPSQGTIEQSGFSRSKQAKIVQPAGGLLYQLAVQDEDEPVNEELGQNETVALILEQGRLLIQYLIVGALAAWIVPARFYRWSDRLRRRPVASGLYGFVGFITGFAGVIILFILVLAIGIGLSSISLHGLATVTWGLGFSSLFLAFWVFLLFVLLISKVIVSYLGGLLILERLAPRVAKYWIWPLLLGLFLYALLSAIPSFGLVISFLVTIFGLGAAILALNRRDIYTGKAVEEEE